MIHHSNLYVICSNAVFKRISVYALAFKIAWSSLGDEVFYMCVPETPETEHGRFAESLYISSAQNLWAFPLSYTHSMGQSLHCHCSRLTAHLQVTRSSKLQARWLAQLCQQTNQHYTFSVLETVSQIRCCISLTSDCCFTLPPPKMPTLPLETPFSHPLKNTRKRGKSQADR